MKKLALISVIGVLAAGFAGCSSTSDDWKPFCEAYCTNYQACEKAKGNGFNYDGCMEGCKYEQPGLAARHEEAFMDALQQCLAGSGCNEMADCVHAAIEQSNPNYQSDPDYQACSTLATACDPYVSAFVDHCETMFALEQQDVIEAFGSSPFDYVKNCVAGLDTTTFGCLGSKSATVLECLAAKQAGTITDTCEEDAQGSIAVCKDPNGDGDDTQDGPAFCMHGSCTDDSDCYQVRLDACKDPDGDTNPVGDGPALCLPETGMDACVEDADCETGETCLCLAVNEEGDCTDGICNAGSCDLADPACPRGHVCTEYDELCDLTVDPTAELCMQGKCFSPGDTCILAAPACGAGSQCMEVNEYCDYVAQVDTIPTCQVKDCIARAEEEANSALSDCLSTSGSLAACMELLETTDPDLAWCACANAVVCMEQAGAFSYPSN